MKIEFSEEELRDIYNCYEQGMTYKELAAKHYVSSGTIGNLVRAKGCPRHEGNKFKSTARKIPLDEATHIHERHRTGIAYSKLASAAGVSKTTLKRVLIAYGLYDFRKILAKPTTNHFKTFRGGSHNDFKQLGY